MSAGALTSVGTFFSGTINNFNIAVASVPVLSIEYLYMIFTALVMGMAGALGGLIIREAYKGITKVIFPDKENTNKNEDEN